MCAPQELCTTGPAVTPTGAPSINRPPWSFQVPPQVHPGAKRLSTGGHYHRRPCVGGGAIHAGVYLLRFHPPICSGDGTRTPPPILPPAAAATRSLTLHTPTAISLAPRGGGVDRPRSTSDAGTASAGACGGRRTAHPPWRHCARPRLAKRRRRLAARKAWALTGFWAPPAAAAAAPARLPSVACRGWRAGAATRRPGPRLARAGSGGGGSAGQPQLARAPRGALRTRVSRSVARATRRGGCKAAAAVPAGWRTRRRGWGLSACRQNRRQRPQLGHPLPRGWLCACAPAGCYPLPHFPAPPLVLPLAAGGISPPTHSFPLFTHTRTHVATESVRVGLPPNP